MIDQDAYSRKLYELMYSVYDRFLNRINLPSNRCSQCERRIRHWVYRIKGLIYCQDCADEYVALRQAEISWLKSIG